MEKEVEGKLIAALLATVKRFYGDNPQASASYGRIVNKRHFDRIASLLTSHRGEVVTGGTTDASDLYIAPTIIRGVDPNSPIMKVT